MVFSQNLGKIYVKQKVHTLFLRMWTLHYLIRFCCRNRGKILPLSQVEEAIMAVCRRGILS